METLLKNISSNFNLKLMAALIAVMIWYFAHKELTLTIDKNVDVRISAPEGYLITAPKKYSALISLTGHVEAIKNLRGRELKAYIVLKEKKEGYLSVELRRKDILNIGDDIDVDVRGISFPIQVDRLISKTVPVKFNLIGLPHHRYFLKRVFIDPQTVELKGARSVLDEINFVSNSALDITGVQTSQSYKAPIGSHLPSGTQIFPEHVRISVTVEEIHKQPETEPRSEPEITR